MKAREGGREKGQEEWRKGEGRKEGGREEGSGSRTAKVKRVRQRHEGCIVTQRLCQMGCQIGISTLSVSVVEKVQM